MEKRLILAVAVSLLIVAGFQIFMGKLYNKTGANIVSQAPQTKVNDIPAEKIAEEPKKLTNIEEKLTTIETNKYFVTLSNIGGSVKEILLKEYKFHGKSLIVTNTENSNERIFVINGIDDLNNVKFEEKKTGLSLSYSYKVNEKLEITKKYTFPENDYGIYLEIFFKNLSNGPEKISYNLIGASNIDLYAKGDEKYLTLTSKIDNKILNLKNKKNVLLVKEGNVDWISLSNRYFSLTLKPLGKSEGIFSKLTKNNNSLIGIKVKESEIPANSTISNQFFLYAGPNDVNIIKNLDKEIDDSINYGFFDSISKILLWMLRFFHKIVPNWGFAIILLSIAVNLILYPLSMTSYKSMKKLQILQPHMEKLRKEHKSDPQKLQKEMMELYKKHKVNPMGGCLPMILQMPIFFALYNALLKSIELRGSNFLWIRDLSMPEGIKLPFSLPFIGDSFNLLPIFMVIAMFLQQKVSSASAAYAASDEQMQQQKIMMVLFPVIFGVILYNFPSGLVLYWLVNTVATFIQQKAIMKSV